MRTMTAQRTYRILHLASSERWTGVAEPAVSLARETQAAGHEVWFGCVPGRSFERQIRARGLRFVDRFHLDRRLHPGRFFSDLAAIRRFVRENRIDIVHTHLLHDNWLSALSLARAVKPPLLVRTFHRWEPPRRDPFHRWLFGRRNDLTIVTSRSLLALFDGRIALRPDSARVVYGGVDSEKFNPEVSGRKIREEFGVADDAPVAGIVARMTHGRGHRWLLDGAPSVFREVADARILIVGRGPLKKPIRAEIAASAQLRGKVIMTGYRYEDLPEAYAAVDATLFLGMGSEGTCRAILEAMAAGKPVIGLRDQAVPEIIDDGKTGLLVERDNAQALADAIVRLLTDRATREEMGRAARQAALTRFSERRRCEDTLEAYDAAFRDSGF
jgi:glycosyltransferase involved in cell wall biosynthesis